MKRFLIPATLLFILLVAFGCGNSDNILAPETTTGNDVTLSSSNEAEVQVLAQIKSEASVSAAPKAPKDSTEEATSTDKGSKKDGGVTKKTGPSQYYYPRR